MNCPLLPIFSQQFSRFVASESFSWNRTNSGHYLSSSLVHAALIKVLMALLAILLCALANSGFQSPPRLKVIRITGAFSALRFFEMAEMISSGSRLTIEPTDLNTIITNMLHPHLSYLPSHNAFFVNSECLAFDVHPSGDYIAFSTRDNKVILRNEKLGRAIILHQSSDQVLYLKFMNETLLAVKHSVNEVLAFSLKSEKLKKKITGHRLQPIKLSYCRQKEIFVSISEEECLIFQEGTLNKLKTLRCSTSSFTECLFVESGQYLFTGFKDGTGIRWDLNDFTSTQFSMASCIKMTANATSLLAIYNQSTISITDFSRSPLIFQEIDLSLGQEIMKVELIKHFLVVKTNLSLYIAELEEKNRWMVKSLHQFDLVINDFVPASYQTQLLLLTDMYRKFNLVSIEAEDRLFSTTVANPLTNPGLTCAGGFSSTEGCKLVRTLKQTNNYVEFEHQIEGISEGTYQIGRDQFSVQKLRSFLTKHSLLPDKHRPAAYIFLLNLPINRKQSLDFQAKGLHECVQLLDARYPLPNLQLANTMKQVISMLAHAHGLFAEAENIPAILFPFVCLFGDDEILCCQIVWRLFTNWLPSLYTQFPVANSRLLQSARQVLSKEDPQLLNFFTIMRLSFTKLAWGLLSNLFTSCLPREAFLAVVDHLFTRPHEPHFLLFTLLGFIIYNRKRIMSFRNQTHLDNFLETEQTVHTAKFIKQITRLSDKYTLTYKFPTVDLTLKSYKEHNLSVVPKDALAMYAGRRRLQTEQLRTMKESENYKEKATREMEQMVRKAKQDSEAEQIKKESYDLLCEGEKKGKLQFASKDRSDRLRSIEALIDELTALLQSQQAKRVNIGKVLPAYNQLSMQSDAQLDGIQQKLMEMLMKYKPTSFEQPIYSKPFGLKKGPNEGSLRSALSGQMASKLWELDELQQANQRAEWERGVLRSLPT